MQYPYVNKEQLTKVSPKTPSHVIDTFLPHLNQTMLKYDISTYLRVCHFLAQVLHESGGFRYTEEIASGSAYEGRKDLGNTHPGDGKLFKGRGLIQLTGRFNYEAYSKDTGVDFISSPTLLSDSPVYSTDVAGWFWSTKNLNSVADTDDIRKITKKINGGYNGLQDRQKYLTLLKLALKSV